MLPVLVGLEYLARNAPHARLITAFVAFAPMVLWELTKSPGDFPSVQGAVLGVTAALFTAVARLPAHVHGDVTERGAAEPPDGPVVTPR